MGLCRNHIRYFGTLWWEDYTVISVLKSVLAFCSFKCTLLSVDAFPNTAQTLCLSTKCWFHPIFPSKTVMNGAICTLLSWQNTPILLLGRQKAANNNRRIWQFKRSIKATPRLTIKAVSPFKDGSKDPFASLLFWGIELYKFTVKESCFFSRVWFGVFKEEEKKNPISNSVCIWHIYDESVCDVWVTVRRMQASEHWRGAGKGAARRLRRDRSGAVSREKIVGSATTVITLVQVVAANRCDATASRQTAGYLLSFRCTSLQKKASSVQTFYPRRRLFLTFPYRDKPTEMESCFSRVILTSPLEIVGFSGWPLRFLRSASK